MQQCVWHGRMVGGKFHGESAHLFPTLNSLGAKLIAPESQKHGSGTAYEKETVPW